MFDDQARAAEYSGYLIAPLAPLVCLTGVTASGKTQVALELAERLGAEILSLDSMAIYRGMDIGTAKPSAAERARIPHHMLDLVEPTEEFSLAQYVRTAHAQAASVAARGRVPLFVGGTPLYLKALLRGLFVGPPPDWSLRRRWQQFAEQCGAAALHAELARVDPRAAAVLHERNQRRIIRALEVYELLGRPLSSFQGQFDRVRDASDCRVFVLAGPGPEMAQRINSRVGAMFSAGLVTEVEGLLSTYGSLGRTARQAVGYREVLEHLAGERGLAETIELVKLRTRQFARRQGAWFRGLAECRPVPGADRAQAADWLAAELTQWQAERRGCRD